MATRAESRVTSGGFSILTYELSADGRRIAHHRAPSTVLGDAERGEVWVMDADGGNAVALTKNTVAESGASLSPDGSQLLFLSGSNERFETYYNANLFVMPAAGGTARDLTRDVRQRDHRRCMDQGRRGRSSSSPTWACTASSTRSRRRAGRRRR